jgi:succinate dehydrogenase/fumarate reductase flavoprotein subunit
MGSDVVVVGSGGAAVAAALTAAVGGASVTVLERSPLFGGTTAVSGGGMWLPGNDLDPDWTDDLAGAKTYLQRLTLGLVRDEVLDRFLAEAGQLPTYLAEHTPLSFNVDIGRPDYHAPWEGSSPTSRTVFPEAYELSRLGEFRDRVRRPGPGGLPPFLNHLEELEFMNKGMEAVNELIRTRNEQGLAVRGVALIGGIIEGCLEQGVEFVADTRVRELIVEDGRVVGVRAEQSGAMVEYRADLGVVLASGGFEWNQDMWKAFMGVPWDGPVSPPFNEGDSIVMAAKVGAKLANLDKATWILSRHLGEEHDGAQYVRTSLFGALPGEILVNREGRRFVNEALNYNDIGRPMTAFDAQDYEFVNYPCFAITDQSGKNRVANLDAKIVGDGEPSVQADTLAELAEQLGIDPDGLERQVAEFNEHARHGEDPVFHRGDKPWDTHLLPRFGLKPVSVAPIDKPPYIGYRVRPGVFGTRGGPVIDENAQIVDFENRPIPGLYGAGNAVASPFASAYPGGGGTIGPAVVFGHVAGTSVVADRSVARGR